MNFEWDESKREKNIAKHGIDFVRAINVFDDDNRVERIDSRCDYGETRYQVIGMVDDKIILFVVHVNRNENIRIISARRANKIEIGDYYGNS